MQTKKVIKKVCLKVVGIIACVVIFFLAFWLIDGRSPQAFIVAHSLPQTTMEDYEKGKGDMTDKSVVEIPDGVEFPHEVKQYKVGGHAGIATHRSFYRHMGSVLYGYRQDLRQDEGRRRRCPSACEGEDGPCLSSLALPRRKGFP